MENIYNAIQNVYNMDKTTWQEVLAELYNLVSKVENKFDLFENKFGQLLGEEVTIELKKMYDDGSLAALINDKLLKEVSEQMDTKANEDDLEVERQRINSFVSLNEGSTTGDAELIDARVGADGVTYANLGNGIRTQLNNIKTGLETLSSVDNIITIDKFSNELVEGLGKYIDKYNLVLGTNAYKGACTITSNKLTSFTSEYSNNRWAILNVTSGQRLKISLRSYDTTNYHIILADKDNNVVANYINDKDKVYTDYELIIPKNVTKLGVNSYSYLPTVLSYSVYSPLVNKDYVDNEVNFLNEEMNVISNKIGDLADFTNYKTNIEFISRQGQINNYPENSIYGIKSAYENGYDNIRVSVSITADHVPVLCHDNTINRLARNSDGTPITDTIYVKDLTLEQLNAYDWGRISGKPEIYGIGITTLEEFVKFAKYRGVKIRLELKDDFADEDIKTIKIMLVKWGMLEYTTLCGSVEVLNKFYTDCKTCNYALVAHINNTNIIKYALAYKNENNSVWVDMFSDDYDITTTDLILQYKASGIKLKVGSAINGTDIKNWFEKGVDGIEVAYYGNPHKYIYSQYS